MPRKRTYKKKYSPQHQRSIEEYERDNNITHEPTYWDRFWSTARRVAPYAGAYAASRLARYAISQANPDWWNVLYQDGTYDSLHEGAPYRQESIPDVEDIWEHFHDEKDIYEDPGFRWEWVHRR